MTYRARRWQLALATTMTLGVIAGSSTLPARALYAQTAPVPGPSLGKLGTFRQHPGFPSKVVAPRDVEVWLPPDYVGGTSRYPVLYVHDGQSVFDPATAFGGVDWALDETMTRLIIEKRIRPAIVVAIANTPKRFQEYMPRKAIGADSVFTSGLQPPMTITGPILSDAYLRFITTELKPFIDRTYRTKPTRANTFIMGSSMGGLISLYAISELPGVFGGAACLSTHWPAADGAAVDYLRRTVPKARDHRLYFDRGTATLDSLYAPYQDRVDRLLRDAGYEDGEHFETRVFEGAEHSERSWRQRLEFPLIVLLRR
jgi:predicted alpha/beta superfamily hydrolase